MLSILLVSKTGGTYENEKNKSIGAGTDHDSVWCGICKGNAGGSEGECSAFMCLPTVTAKKTRNLR